MSLIGQFTSENDGFIGHLMTLTLHQDIIIVPAEPSDAENAPDFRVHVLDSMKLGLAYEEADAGLAAQEKHGELLPQATR